MAEALDSILDDKEPEAPEAPEAREPEAEPAAPKDHSEDYKSRKKKHQAKEFTAQGRDPETGQFKPKEAEPAAPAAASTAAPAPATPAAATPATPAAPAQPEFTEREKAFLRAAHEERVKRQELERKYAQPAPPAEPAKTFYEDPDGYAKNLKDEVQKVAVNTRLNTAEMIARQKYTDFDDKTAVFAQLVSQTPGLVEKWLAAPDPAEFAYRTGLNHQRLEQAGNIDALLEKTAKETEAKVRAAVEAEFKAKAEEDAKIRAALPGSLSDARSTGNRVPAWTGPASLDDILKG